MFVFFSPFGRDEEAQEAFLLLGPSWLISLFSSSSRRNIGAIRVKVKSKSSSSED